MNTYKPDHEELKHALGVIGNELETTYLSRAALDRLVALELIKNDDGQWLLTDKGMGYYLKLERGQEIPGLSGVSRRHP
ncbi:MAG TPA: hypothetical protein VMJ32_17255 [Pirellulales bacterium]|nr:hypothetical protein [Pirellulales bacterium]